MMINAREFSAAKKFDYVNVDKYFIAKEFDCFNINQFFDSNSEKDSLLYIIKTFDRVILDEICAAKAFEIFCIFNSMFCD